MLQNATTLRKSAPGPPNSSDEDVSCTAPATEMASLQILCKCPTPAMVFGNVPKLSRFAHFWQGAQSLAPATRNDIWTSKSGPNPWCFNILTSKCASRHNGVLFFDISTSKSAPNGKCFLAFSLANVLRATTARTFSTSQLPKALRTWSVLSFFTCKCASRHNGVHFFISHLARWLRTRRFSEPTFRPSGNHKSLEKHSVSRLSYLFAHLSFFLLNLSLLWSSLFYSSLLSDSSCLCFSSVHIVGSLTSKLPSIT